MTGPSLTRWTCITWPKHPVAVVTPCPAREADEEFVEPLAVFRRRGTREARPVAAARVGGEGELADDQRSAAARQNREVHLTRLALEDAQVGDLAREQPRLVVAVARHRADKDQQPRADLADRLAAGHDTGLRDPLDERSHASSGAQ